MKLTTDLHLGPRLRRYGGIPPFLQYVFMAWYFIKHKDNFTLLIVGLCMGILFTKAQKN
jgi:hypothetical protein